MAGISRAAQYRGAGGVPTHDAMSKEEEDKIHARLEAVEKETDRLLEGKKKEDITPEIRRQVNKLFTEHDDLIRKLMRA
jgi:hypothetical protein